jgi:hypothetical protein
LPASRPLLQLWKASQGITWRGSAWLGMGWDDMLPWYLIYSSGHSRVGLGLKLCKLAVKSSGGNLFHRIRIERYIERPLVRFWISCRRSCHEINDCQPASLSKIFGWAYQKTSEQRECHLSMQYLARFWKTRGKISFSN